MYHNSLLIANCVRSWLAICGQRLWMLANIESVIGSMGPKRLEFRKLSLGKMIIACAALSNSKDSAIRIGYFLMKQSIWSLFCKNRIYKRKINWIFFSFFFAIKIKNMVSHYWWTNSRWQIDFFFPLQINNDDSVLFPRNR